MAEGAHRCDEVDKDYAVKLAHMEEQLNSIGSILKDIKNSNKESHSYIKQEIQSLRDDIHKSNGVNARLLKVETILGEKAKSEQNARNKDRWIVGLLATGISLIIGTVSILIRIFSQ